MPIIGQCGECGHKFQAPDHLAGQRVKCPNCSAPLRIERAEDHDSRQAPGAKKASSPAEKASAPPEKASVPPKKASAKPEGSQPSARTKGDWYVQTGDGQHHGPVQKAQLDKLAAAGRLDGFCRIRREDWDAWRWAEDIYPQLASSPKSGPEDERPSGETKPDRPVPSPRPEPRLVTCPDCGKTVSRRASQCPQCGCPAVILSGQDPPEEAAPPVAPAESGPQRRKPAFWFVTGGAVVALVVVTLVSVWAWNRWRAVNRVVDQVESLVGEVVEPPTPPEPTDEVVSLEVLQQYMREASAEWAKNVDSEYRMAHLATSLMDRTQETLNPDLIEALAGGDLDAIPDAVPADPSKAGAERYQSKVESLYEECYRYLVQNVSPEKADRSIVWETAKRWADAKQAALGEEMGKEMEKLLGL